MNARRRAAACLADERGVAAVEFSLVLFPFLALLLAIMEVGYLNYENELLVAAVAESKRALLTGKTQANASVNDAASFVRTYICPPGASGGASGNFDCSKLVVDIRPVTTFAAADLSNSFASGATKFCPGQAGQASLMRVAYPLPAIFPLNLFDPAVHNVTVGSQTGAFHILLATALFQGEDFSGGRAPAAGC